MYQKRRKILSTAIISLFIISMFSIAMPSALAQPSITLSSDEGKDKVSELPPALKEKIDYLLQQIEEIKAGDNYIKGERIVVFKPVVTKDKIDGIIAKVNPVSVKDVAKFGERGAEKVIKLLKFDSEDKAKQAESDLKSDPNVLYVVKNFKVKVPPIKHEQFKGKAEINPMAPTADPFRSYQWYLFKTKEQFAPFAPTAPMVAVIDTGVQYDHPELFGRVVLGYDYVDDDYYPYDENGHGTAVAGIIGAKVNNGIGIAGISPRSMIYAIRVLDESGSGEFADILAGTLISG
jgi:thermitase